MLLSLPPWAGCSWKITLLKAAVLSPHVHGARITELQAAEALGGGGVGPTPRLGQETLFVGGL